eukprot:scaffold149634_cov46-Attheya_sp.AAC.1
MERKESISPSVRSWEERNSLTSSFLMLATDFWRSAITRLKSCTAFNINRIEPLPHSQYTLSTLGQSQHSLVPRQLPPLFSTHPKARYTVQLGILGARMTNGRA